MKILDPSPYRENIKHTCNRCWCDFEYTFDDIETYDVPKVKKITDWDDKEVNIIYEHYVECPECGTIQTIDNDLYTTITNIRNRQRYEKEENEC